jgi:transposase-like protein
MSRATRRRLGKRESRRRFEANLRQILKLDREGYGPRAIADSLQIDSSFVARVLQDFRAFQEARRT